MPIQILAAEDSATIRRALAIAFAVGDYALTGVASAEEALQSARRQRPDVAILDAGLAGTNGYDLCAAFRAEASLRSVGVILLASTFVPYDEKRGARAGVDAAVVKPFDCQTLIDKVATVYARRAADRAAAPSPAATAAAEEPAPDAAPPGPPPVEIDLGLEQLQPAPEAAPPAPAAPAAGSLPEALRPADFGTAAAAAAATAQAAAAGAPSPPAGAMAAAKAPTSDTAPPAPRPSLLPGAPVPTTGSKVASLETLQAQATVRRPAPPPSAVARETPVAPAAPAVIARIGPRTTPPPPPPPSRRPTLQGIPEVDLGIPDNAELAAPPAPAPAAPAAAPPASAPPAAPPPVAAPPAASAPASVAEALKPALARAVDAKVAELAARGPEYAAIAALSREVIEQIAWEVVPELAEIIIRAELDRLVSERGERK